MKVVIQKVTSASVTHENETVAEIGEGYVILVGISKGCSEEQLRRCASRILGVKLFENWTKNVVESEKEILLLSQFTLFGTCKGNKPSFHHAESHEKAEIMFKRLVEIVKEQYPKVKSGLFRKYLEVSLTNTGPTTLLLDF